MKINGEYCTVCGKPATAIWDGPSDRIAICQECAIVALPALLADAVYVPPSTAAHDQLKRYMERAELAYWRAMALRLAKLKGPTE